MVHSATEHVIRLFMNRGQGRYGSEQVTQLEHALQCAVLAKRQGAGSAMIGAALLHDLGHIIDDQAMPGSDTENLDDAHEERAYGWIESNFGKAVPGIAQEFLRPRGGDVPIAHRRFSG